MPFLVISKGKEILHLHVRDIKVSLLGFPYPLLFPTESFDTVSIADARDIACMKLSAVAGRGSRRDFIDLYLLGREFGLHEIMAWFKSKFSRTDYNMVHIMKSLTYFEDSDGEPMPDMISDISWEQVKKFFIEAVPRMIGRQ